MNLNSIPFIPAHSSNYAPGRGGHEIEYIVLHYTANDGDTDANNAKYFQGANRLASAHYFVDEDSVTQTVRDTDSAWHCGGGLQGSGGHAFFGKCRNANSIGIELCSDKANGRFVLTEATVSRAAALTRALMDKYGVPLSRVIRHYDVTGKTCPEPWVRDEGQWKKFKQRLEEPELTETQIRAIVRDELNKAQAEQEAKTPSAWGLESWQKATQAGITDGTSPQAPMTREMCVTMLDRAGVLREEVK